MGRAPISLEARPPFLAPRRAEHEAMELERFVRWLRRELGLDAGAQIDVIEYISFDTRDTPHTTRVSVSSRSGQHVFWVGKALREIRAEDLPRRPR